MGPTEYKVQEIERVVNKIDGKLDKLDDRMDKLENSYARMEVTLEVNTASLQEHMRRTDILEKAHVSDKAVRKFLMWVIGVVGVSGLGDALKWIIGQ